MTGPEKSNNDLSRKLPELLSELFSIKEEVALLDTVLKSIITILGFDVAYFRMLAPDGYLELQAHNGTQSDFLHNPKERRLAPYEGINWKAIKNEQLLVISDVRNEADFRHPEVIERENLIGALIKPIKAADGMLGALSCYTRHLHEFSDQEKEIINTIGNVTAAALSNLRYLSELNELDKFIQELAKTSTIKEVLISIAEYAKRLSKADGVTIIPYDSEKKLFALSLRHSIGIGRRKELAQRRRPTPHSITMQVLEKQIIRLGDKDIEETPYLSPEIKSILSEDGVHAFVGIALQVNNPVGVMYLNYTNPTDLPTQQELEKYLTKFIAHATLAIERAWLFEHRQQEQKLIESASQLISDLNNIKDVEQKFLEYAIDQTGATAGCISIVSNDGIYLERIVHFGIPDHVKSRYRIQGHSFQSKAAIEKLPIIIRDVSTEEKIKGYYPVLPTSTSILAVPIYATNSEKKRVIGIINLEAYEASTFTVSDLRLIELLAVHTNIVLKIAESYRKLENESKRLHSLQNAARDIASSNQQDTLSVILKEAVNLTGADFATIQKLNDGYLQFLEVLPTSRWETLHKLIPDGIMRLDDGRGLTVQAAQNKVVVRENDVDTNPAYWDGNESLTRSELVVPMMIDKNTLWGILNVEKSEKYGFTDEHEETLKALANMAVAAVQRDHHYNDIQRSQTVEAISYALLFVIHRLRNNINLIPADADAAMEELQQFNLPTNVEEKLKRRLNSIRAKGRLIDKQIIDIYHPFDNRINTINPKEVFESLQNQKIIPQDVDFSYRSDDSNIRIAAKKEMLIMILENMVQNSVSQLLENGRIQLWATSISEDWVHLHVYDNGKGIPSDKLKKVNQFSFNFELRPDTPIQVSRGMGLGLSLAYWYVKKIGGDIQVESRVTLPDHGTRITLKLPRANEKQIGRLSSLGFEHE